MLTRDKVNSIFGIKESYKLPEKLMTMLFDDPQKIYDALKDEDMGSDFFRDYFQECQGDRVAFKQDFTPDSIGEIIANLLDEPSEIGDMCAGTGSLTIQAWKKYPNAKFTCFEVSEFPVS